MKNFILSLFCAFIFVGCTTNKNEDLNTEPLVILKAEELDKFWIYTQGSTQYSGGIIMPRESGFVKVKYLINSNGEVINPIILESKGGWDDLALELKKNTRYTNSEYNLDKIPVYFVDEMEFSAQERSSNKVLPTDTEIYNKFASLNLEKLGESDQAARSGNFDEVDWQLLQLEDAGRRARAKEILATGSDFSAQEYFLAALIMQHGADSESYKEAMNLAKKAVEIDPDHIGGKSLSCAAEDRFLQSTGSPQVWGTQLTTKQHSSNSYEILYLDNFDKQARSDIDRQNLCGLPSLKIIEQKLEVMETLSTFKEQIEYWSSNKP